LSQTSPATPPRHTHGFQNQAAGPQVQAATANEVAPSPEPGTSSKQQAKAFLESQGNPKRKRGSHDEYTDPTNHTLDTINARPAKRNKEFTGEYLGIKVQNLGRETIALTPIKGHFTATPHTDAPKKYRKPRSGSKTKQKQSRPKGH
jgi:hypothetical protein